MNLTSLLKKYNVAGPRYTSYPTVPEWTEQVESVDYQRALTSLQTEEKLSLYFHIPFCERLCHFCGCMRVITEDHRRTEAYIRALLTEMRTVQKNLGVERSRVCQIHFGGGTPNFLKPEELEQIFEEIKKIFSIEEDAEIAIEMHPRTSTVEFCQKLKKLGFNRISLGVQDFDPQVQQLIHRNQTYEQTREMVDILRDLGFHSFNFDLIYGLPGQSLETWRETLEKVIELSPDRLAVYSYAHVPWKSPVQRSFKDQDLPSPELKIQLFEEAYQMFLSQGYRSIGMDHFAKEGDELSQALDRGTIHRNFMGYTTRAEAHQLGFGVSSISYVDGHYFQNEKDLKTYEQRAVLGELTTFRGCLLDQEDSIRRDLITQIMCRAELDFEKFSEKWKISFKEYFYQELNSLSELIEDGLLIVDENRLHATSSGKLFLRNIAMVFDPYYQRQKLDRPTFSKTV